MEELSGQISSDLTFTERMSSAQIKWNQAANQAKSACQKKQKVY